MSDPSDRLLEIVQCVVDSGMPPSDQEPLNDRLRRNIDVLSRIAAGRHEPPPGRGKSDDVLERWGSLQPLAVLGQGGFGTVYRAWDPNLERDVALKLKRLNSAQLFDERAFIDEARRLARVRHSNVLAVYGADVHAGQVGIWMDLILGPSLSSLLKTGGAWTETRLMALAVQLSAALEAVHKAGLVHGDIKTENVLIDERLGAVLGDFGAASEWRHGAPVAARQGTLHTMAPEAIQLGALSPKSDIYSLGVLCYRVLRGAYPGIDRNGSLAGTLKKLRGSPIKLLIRRMLDSDPDKRPSATEVLTRLRWIQGAPGRRLKTIAAGASGVMLLAIAGSSTVAWRSAEQGRIEAETARARVDAVNAYLVDTLKYASPVHAEQDTTMREILQASRERLDERLAGQPEVLAELQYTLGAAFLALRDRAAAKPLFEKAAQSRDSDLAVRAQIALIRMERDASVAQNAYHALLDSLPQRQPVTTQTRALLHTRFGEQLADDNQHDVAIEQLRLAEHLWTTLDNPDDPNRGVLEIALGNLAAQRMEFTVAEHHLENASQIFRSSHGFASPDMLAASINLAHCKINLGKLNEAETLLREALVQTPRSLGEEHPHTIAARNALASLLGKLGRDTESVEAYAALIPFIERVRGADSLESLAIRGNYANGLGHMGRFEEAAAQYLDIIARLTGKEGQAVPMRLVNRHNLAELYLDSGQLQRGVTLQRAVLADMIDLFGPDHLFALEAEENIAVHAWRSGDPAGALTQIESVLTRKTAQLGDNNSFTLEAVEIKADILAAMGMHEAAAVLYERVLEQRQLQLGSSHRDTLRAAEKRAENIIRPPR